VFSSTRADLLGDEGLGLVPLMSLMDMLGRLESVELFGGIFSEMDGRWERPLCTEERRLDMVWW